MEETGARAVAAAPAKQQDSREEVSILMLGREQSGRTSLVLSLEALRTGTFPKRADRKGSQEAADTRHCIPPRIPGGLPLMITDTQPCGATDQVRLPGGRRIPIALRSSSLKHDSVLFVVDGLAPALWEEPKRAEELGQLCATLLSERYTVVLAVTKLLQARQNALQRVAHHGADHGGATGKDPRRCYEEFVSRYLEKVTVTLQATQALRTWHASQGGTSPAFPRASTTIFDVPAWVSKCDFQAWRDRKGTMELPNLRYIQNQLERLVLALSAAAPSAPPGALWHHLADDRGLGRQSPVLKASA